MSNSPTAPAVGFTQKIRHSLELIKFSHSVFALPFALLAFFVASWGNVRWIQLVWILVCVVSARTAAMAFNRLADASYDKKNPRTASRHLPSGLLSKQFVICLTVVTSFIFIVGAFQLNRLAGWLSPVALAILFFYSLTKRFTHFTQLFLGLSLGIAPVGAYIAVQGRIPAEAWFLGCAVLFWVAGFDLLYALQDEDFDRQEGLHSMAVKLGARNTFRLSAAFHLLFLLLLIGFGSLAHLGLVFKAGTALVGALLLWQHWILKADLKRINTAFFTANGLISFLVLAAGLADLWLRSP